MTQQVELLRKIDTLPPEYFGEVFDFVEFLQQKARRETETLERAVSRDTEIINRNAEWLNKETEAFLSYQVDIWSPDQPSSAEVLES